MAPEETQETVVMAATVVTNDPIFGMVAYGGELTGQDKLLHVIPKDGRRTKLYYSNGNNKLDIELNRDGFAKGKTVIIDPSGSQLQFQLENRTGDAHAVQINIKGLKGNFQLKADGTVLKNVIFDHEKAVIIIPVRSVKNTTVTLNKVS